MVLFKHPYFLNRKLRSMDDLSLNQLIPSRSIYDFASSFFSCILVIGLSSKMDFGRDIDILFRCGFDQIIDCNLTLRYVCTIKRSHRTEG